MFSSYNQLINNILFSQRFYYNNYEYYNDYQKIQQKYKDDLSKVFFRLNRKSKGTVFYEWSQDSSLKSKYQQNGSNKMEVQSNSDVTPTKKKSVFGKQIQRQLRIEKLLQEVLQTFHQLNYSDIKTDEQSKKQLYQFVNLKYHKQLNPQEINFSTNMRDQQEQPVSNYETNSIQLFNTIIRQEYSKIHSFYTIVENLNSIVNQNDRIFLQIWCSFEYFQQFFLNNYLIKKRNVKNYKEQMKKLFSFVTKIRYIVERTLAAQYYNSLFINIPSLKKCGRVFHPITMGLTYTNKFFEQKHGYKQKPRIVFLNLDGRQTPYNLKYARNMGQNFLYISVFKEPTHSYKKNQKMEYELDEIQDSNFGTFSDFYARLLINQAYPQYQNYVDQQEKQIFKSKSKMLIFPLNNDYLRKQYYKNIDQSNKKCNPFNQNRIKNFPTLQTSADIFFLFQTVIFQEIRSFNPSFIIVSYNGFLNINEEHWAEIVKTLTIISDHKISLFMDFIDRLSKKRNQQQDDEQSDDQEDQQIQDLAEQCESQENQQQNQQEDDDDKMRSQMLVKEFIGKYIPFKTFWPLIQHQRVLSNMLLFLKLSSGIYSMQPRLHLAPHLKYEMSDRYSYLECLGKSKQMSQVISKYSPKMLKSQELKQLYSNQGNIELKQNRKQNESYLRLVDSVIAQFLDQNNRKQRFGNNYQLLYRLQQILQQQQYENNLKYGGQQDHNPQYSVTISNNSMLSIQNRQMNIMHEYLKQMKKRLLLQNLETYRHRKVFFYDQEADSSQISPNPNQRVKCYKFYLYEDDSEQISFQKYTQTIFDMKKSKVYIVNFRAVDQRHLILHGNITPSMYQKKFSIKVQIVKQSQKEIQNPIYSLFDNFNRQSQFLNSNNNMDSMSQQIPLTTEQNLLQLRKDLVFVNYSHCFVKNKLYLYWPQKWSIKEEIRYKLLGMKYKPQNVNVILKVQFNSQNQCVYQTLQVKQNQKTYVNPRIGCSSYQITSQDDEFFIFGGIQDNYNDFFDIGQGIYHMQIKDNSGFFTVKPLPKVREKNIKQSTISVMSIMRKNMTYVTRLRPKMHYRIQKYIDNSNGANNSQENKIVISGGYGRQFTNFFNMYSYESYLFNVNTKLIETKQVHPRRLIKLPKPIEVNKIGKYYLISNNQNTQQVEQNFSDLPKDLFAYQYKTQKINTLVNPNRQNMGTQSLNMIGSTNLLMKYCQNKQVNSFLDERHRTLQFKLDGKKIYLFGFNRTIREKIYTKFWSPELYVVDGNQSNIVHISLKTQKNFSYNISNFLMPRQQDIVSLCLDQDRLFVLSSSPVIHSIQYSNCKYVLYEGNLSNMNDVVNKHELQMYEKFQFKKQKEYMLKYKTLYAFDQKIYLFGGQAINQDPSISTLTYEQSIDSEMKNNGNNKVSYREDYILQKEKNKFVLKIRKVESQRDSVQMLSPVVIKFNQLLYFYSIQMTETLVKTEGPFPQIQQNYKLKIQTFVSQSAGQGKCTTQLMKFYTYDPMKDKIIRIIPRLDQPKFVSISKHEPFNLSKLKEHLQKVVIRLNKRIEESQLKQQKTEQMKNKCLEIIKYKDEEKLISQLRSSDKFFKSMIDHIKPQVNEKQKNPEEQQLIKDLKICYSLVNKLILQRLVQIAQIQENNKNQTMSQTESVMSENLNSNFQGSMGSMSNQLIKKQKFVEKFERMSLNNQQNMTSYKFIVEDAKYSRKIRYIAIGPLANVQELRFFRIRFRHDVSLCLNKNNQDGFYYHPTINSCEQIDLNDRFAQYDQMSETDIKNEGKSYKDYKLYCQLKV